MPYFFEVTALKRGVLRAAAFAILVCNPTWAQQAEYALSADITGAGFIYSFEHAYLWCTKSGKPTCFTTYPAGYRLTLKVGGLPALIGWGGACAGTVGRECTIVMDSDKFVSAAFEPPLLVRFYEFYTKINGRGAINLSPWDEDGYSRIEHNTAEESLEDFFRYHMDTVVTLTADSYVNGHRFVGWGGICVGSGTGPCSVKVNSAKYAEATFAQIATGGAGNCLSRYFSSDEQRVQDIFIAYYGRPADVGGMKFWSQKLKEKKGDVSSIMDVFGSTPEYRNRFGSLSNSDLVHNLFGQLYGRPADPGGLNFYVNQLNTGQSTLASIALQILDATAPGSDAQTLANRKAVAHHYTTTAEVTGTAGMTLQAFVSLLTQVGADEASANAVCAQISSALN